MGFLGEVAKLLSDVGWIVPVLFTVVLVLGVYVILLLILNRVRNKLLHQSRNKRRKTNIKVIFNLIKYLLFFVIAAIAVFSYTGSWTGLGISVGLLSAAIGFALQKPITSIAAWFLIITKHPYDIGDRILIGTLKGDVIDIDVMHTYLAERGGLSGGEERTGRTILVPNSLLFEDAVINYCKDDDFVIGQVEFQITYESNLDHAVSIALLEAKKNLKQYSSKKDEPFTRISLEASGVAVLVRYTAEFKDLQEVKDKITRGIFAVVKKSKDVEIAYPHMELLFKKGHSVR
ncbi:MAG: mechanosensitive ion channel family protein [Candidatus Woesearchaeota archaeon]